jgi:hypothetical protein
MSGRITFKFDINRIGQLATIASKTRVGAICRNDFNPTVNPKSIRNICFMG